MLRGKLIALGIHVGKEERSRSNNLSNKLPIRASKKEHNKFKVSRRKETIKIKTETNELENRKIIKENQQDQKLVLWAKQQLKSLSQTDEGKKESSHNYQYPKWKRDITTDPTEINCNNKDNKRILTFMTVNLWNQWTNFLNHTHYWSSLKEN